MTSPDSYTYRPDQYAELTLIRKPDDSIEVIIGKDHATGYNSESVTLPPSEAQTAAKWFRTTMQSMTTTGQINSAGFETPDGDIQVHPPILPWGTQL